MALRKAMISSVDNLTGLSTVNFTDNRGQPKTNIKLNQPYVGRGWGIRAGIESNSGVLVEENSGGELYILSYLADPQFFSALPASEEDAVTKAAPKFKDLAEGEIAIQSMTNSLMFLDQLGNISLKTPDGMSFELSKTTDTINQVSANHSIYTEGSAIYNGLIRRDTRTDQQKIDDLFIINILGANFDQEESTDIIGADPVHRVEEADDAISGTFDPSDGTPNILELPGITGTPQAKQIVSNVLSPALTEYRMEINEFSDGITSISSTEQAPDVMKAGYLPANLGVRFTLGTVVNQLGRIPRFDYVFGTGTGKGHGKIWNLPGINETNTSVDFKIDPAATLSTAANLTSTSQWAVGTLDRFNTAIAFQLLLNTRGADHKGKIPDASGTGSQWSLQVDKEGLTKWNIPAATSLTDKEHFRTGRSLLWNMDGSMTMSVGKESNTDLQSITGTTDETKFVNVTTERTDRSWTADFEGTVEWLMGADAAGQSHMIQADGALAFYYGKMLGNVDSIVKEIETSGITAPSKSGNRVGTSISGQTAGSVEFNIGVNNSTAQQSVALNADGVMQITIGQDSLGDSLHVDAAGCIKFQVVNGGHKIEMYSNQAKGNLKDMIRLQHGGLTQSVIQIDQNGVITLRNSLTNSNIIMSKSGDITLMNATGTKISLSLDGTIGIGSGTAGIDISPTSGVTLRTAGGSIALSLTGKVEIAANMGLTVTGLQAHLNTTGVLFGPGAATSAFRVAITGGGLGINPLTGTSESGFSLVGAIG